MNESTGFYDKDHNELFIGDFVLSDNGCLGIIIKYSDSWSFNEEKVVYAVDWNGIHETLGGITNDHISKQF